MNANPLLAILNAFGSQLIAYSLNTDEPTIKAIADGSADPPADNAELFAELVQTLTAVRVSSAMNDYPVAFQLTSLMATSEQGQQSLFNAWRLRAGGSVPSFETGDPVIDALAPLASETYPLVLAASFVKDSSRSDFRPPFNHPAEQHFEKAVMADEALAKLFPNRGSDGISTVAQVTANTGRSGSLQLALFSTLVLRAAYVLMRMRLQLGPEEFKDCVVEVTDIIRKAASGAATSVPAWIGFGNVAIPNEVVLPWGVLRPYPYPTDLELAPPQARPAVTGEEQTVLGMIMETSFDYQIDIHANANFDELFKWPSSMEEQRSRLDRQFMLTSLAFVLAVDRNPPVACTRLWTLVLDPLSFGVDISWNPFARAPVSFHILSPDEEQRVEGWAQMVDSASTKKIEITQRRLLSAISDRLNPVDGFVDAIIAWENLFAGTSQGELSFRICAAMSKLLSTNESGRLAKHKELVDLYNKRSKVVHGFEDLSQGDARKYRDAALDAVVKCLRGLYGDFPDLLDDGDRSKKIILTM